MEPSSSARRISIGPGTTSDQVQKVSDSDAASGDPDSSENENEDESPRSTRTTTSPRRTPDCFMLTLALVGALLMGGMGLWASWGKTAGAGTTTDEPASGVRSLTAGRAVIGEDPRITDRACLPLTEPEQISSATATNPVTPPPPAVEHKQRKPDLATPPPAAAREHRKPAASAVTPSDGHILSVLQSLSEPLVLRRVHARGRAKPADPQVGALTRTLFRAAMEPSSLGVRKPSATGADETAVKVFETAVKDFWQLLVTAVNEFRQVVRVAYGLAFEAEAPTPDGTLPGSFPRRGSRTGVEESVPERPSADSDRALQTAIEHAVDGIARLTAAFRKRAGSLTTDPDSDILAARLPSYSARGAAKVDLSHLIRAAIAVAVAVETDKSKYRPGAADQNKLALLPGRLEEFPGPASKSENLQSFLSGWLKFLRDCERGGR